MRIPGFGLDLKVEDYTEVRLNRKAVWVELTTAGCGYKLDVPKGVPTGGWKLA